jgi:protein phosphatase
MTTGHFSDAGRVRALNEDSWRIFTLADTRALFAVVSDGMGGHNAGEVASRSAVVFAAEYLEAHFSADVPPEKLQSLLREAVKHANKKVYALSLEREERFGMGATFSMALVLGGKYFFAHVGDSRIYVLREKKLHKITIDHSVVQEMVDAGQITEEQARTHPQKNLVTRALGTERAVLADAGEGSFSPGAGDRLLLCSDGLTNLVAEPEIETMLSARKRPQEIADALGELANLRGGTDNVTVLVLGGEV